jgi:hypothetical protein
LPLRVAKFVHCTRGRRLCVDVCTSRSYVYNIFEFATPAPEREKTSAATGMPRSTVVQQIPPTQCLTENESAAAIREFLWPCSRRRRRRRRSPMTRCLDDAYSPG